MSDISQQENKNNLKNEISTSIAIEDAQSEQQDKDINVQKTEQSEIIGILIYEGSSDQYNKGFNISEKDNIVLPNEKKPAISNLPVEIDVKSSKKQRKCDRNMEPEIIVLPEHYDISENKDIGETSRAKETSTKRKTDRKEWVFWCRQESPKQKPQEFQGFGCAPVAVYCSSEPYGYPIHEYYNYTQNNSFVLHTYIITSIMYTFTFVFAIVAMHVEDFETIVKGKYGANITFVFGYVAAATAYSYQNTKCARIFPICLILNIVGTICFSYLYAAMNYLIPYIPLVILGTSLIVVLCLTGLAFTKMNFKSWYLGVLSGLFALAVSAGLLFLLFLIIDFQLTQFVLGFSLFISFISGVMSVATMQIILRGKSKLGVREYYKASFMIYLSVVFFTMLVLMLFTAICNLTSVGGRGHRGSHDDGDDGGSGDDD